MKAIVFSLFFLLYGLFNAEGQENNSFRVPKNLDKEIVLGKYYWKEDPKEDTIRISTYNNGEKVKSAHYYDGEISSYDSLKYDKNNNLIEFKDYGRMGYRSYTDPNTGKEIEEKIWDGTVVMRVKKYYYDDNGRMEKEEYYEFGESLEKRIRYFYDSKNRIKKEEHILYPSPYYFATFKPQTAELDEDAEPISTAEKSYIDYLYFKDLAVSIHSDSTGTLGKDSIFYLNGKVTREKGVLESGKLLYENEYEYDTEEKIIEIKNYTSGLFWTGEKSDMAEHHGRTVYKYYDDGTLKSEENYFNGKISNTYIYKYKIKEGTANYPKK